MRREYNRHYVYDGDSKGGQPPTTLLRHYLNQVLLKGRDVNELHAYLHSKPKWHSGPYLSQYIYRTLEFLAKHEAKVLPSEYIGTFELPIGPFHIQFFPHVTFLKGGVVNHLVLYSTKEVEIHRRYYGAFNALAEHLLMKADRRNEQVVIFDATKNLWMRSASDVVHLNHLLEGRFKTWKNVVADHQGIKMPFDDNAEGPMIST